MSPEASLPPVDVQRHVRGHRRKTWLVKATATSIEAEAFAVRGADDRWTLRVRIGRYSFEAKKPRTGSPAVLARLCEHVIALLTP